MCNGVLLVVLRKQSSSTATSILFQIPGTVPLPLNRVHKPQIFVLESECVGTDPDIPGFLPITVPDLNDLYVIRDNFSFPKPIWINIFCVREPVLWFLKNFVRN